MPVGNGHLFAFLTQWPSWSRPGDGRDGPVVVALRSEAMSENLRNFTKALYGMDAVVRRVDPARWDDASPCPGWSARDVVAHQVGVLRGLTETVRTGEMALPAEPEDRSDPVALWNEARDAVVEALDRPGRLQQSGRYWFGEMTIDELIAVVQWDPLTHAWDLATATGQPAHLDEGLAQRSYDTISSMREALAKRKLVSEEAVPVADDADIVSRYLGLVGRNPAG